MTANPPAFFEGTERPTAGWWEALWPDPAGVLAAVGIKHGMDVIDLCSGDGWFTLQIAKIARGVTAIDIDPNLLNVAPPSCRKRCDELRLRGERCPCACRSRVGACRFCVHGERLSRCPGSASTGPRRARDAQDERPFCHRQL